MRVELINTYKKGLGRQPMILESYEYKTCKITKEE